MSNIWKKIKEKTDAENRPIFVMAPMADVTDPAFRRIIASRGNPDAMWTEFVSSDGLALADSVGKEKLKRALLYSEIERPVIAQFFTSNPDHMYESAVLAREMGFDGIDINMGCPDKGVERQGAGASLIKTPKIAKALIRAAKEGASGLAVSVKTRIGYNKNELETWLPELLSENPDLITVHARTRKEMSKVPARFEHVKRAVEIRNEMGKETLIFGNGDILNIEDAKEKAQYSGADGIMLGRAIFGNPWLFSSLHNKQKEISIKEKLETMVEHTKLFAELLGDIRSFAIMKKHYKAYVNGWDGAKELRLKLMETENAKEVEDIVKKYLSLS